MPHTLTLTVPAAELVAATTSQGARTLTGTAVPYGVPGNTSAGRIAVAAGAIALPENLARVKLVAEHLNPPRPIGYATDADDTPEGLRMAFHVANTPDGDSALLEASEGVRDAFSVELADVTLASDGATVTAARLTAVALVTVPAFESAIVTEIAASQPKEEGTPAMPENTEATPATTEATEAPAVTAASAPTNPPAPAQAATPSPVPATMPTDLGTARPARHQLEDFYAAQSRVLTGRSRPDLEAALADITYTGNEFTSRDDYSGELWSGLSYQRRYVGMLNPGRLTSYKGTGWRWVTKPAVADYAGDKTPVPSNQPTTEATEWTAARLAGAHDLDRKFIDFGDTEFIASYYRALTESYALQSDLKARAFILASATTSATVLPAGSSILDAALVAKMELENAEDDGFAAGTPDYYLVNSTDYASLMGVKASDVSAFLSALGIDPSKFTATNAVPAGSVIAGVKAAGTFRELPGSPIRVETVDLANGGVDGGVFGYYATELHNAKGIVEVTIAAA